MQLTGIHHLTAVTANIAANHAFYTGTLGLRLVKKTVNQDDISAYHLFYADGLASPGTDMTFFDWPVPREARGTNCVGRTGFRVGSEATLGWWAERFARLGVKAAPPAVRDGRLTVDFEDGEGQRLCLVVEQGGAPANAWAKSTVPTEHQIRGLGPIFLSVPLAEPTEQVLKDVLSLRAERTYHLDGGASDGAEVRVWAMGPGGPAAELHLVVEPGLPRARQGAGAVHHLALRTPNEQEYAGWAARLGEAGVPSSGPVDRYYFRSLYFREPNGILFEIATDGPGFTSDEPLEKLGEGLALPPFLEPRRTEIEAGLKPLSPEQA